MSDIVYRAAERKGWALNKNPADKEQLFVKKTGLEIVDAGVEEQLEAVNSEIHCVADVPL